MAWASKSVMVAVPSRATATRTLPFISAAAATALWLYIFILCVGVGVGVGGTNTNTNRITREEATPTPRAWPEQFHSILLMNYSGELQVIDLWYDWPNGRNFNIIQHQLGNVLYDLEWNNGTSFFFSSDNDNDNNYCSSAQLEVGILRPNWLVGAEYVGQRHLDGFLCNVWVKADFITYYEDVLTYRPVHWLFYSGRGAHVMTFEVGAVLEDAKWQVPAYCFDNNNKTSTATATATGDDAYASYYKQQQQQTTQKVINNALDTSFQQHLIINRLLRGSMLF